MAVNMHCTALGWEKMHYEDTKVQTIPQLHQKCLQMYERFLVCFALGIHLLMPESAWSRLSDWNIKTSQAPT